MLYYIAIRKNNWKCFCRALYRVKFLVKMLVFPEREFDTDNYGLVASKKACGRYERGVFM